MNKRLKAASKRLPKLGGAAKWLMRQPAHPGSAPGIEHAVTAPNAPTPGVTFEVFDYNVDHVTHSEPATLEQLLESKTTAGSRRWINVNGLNADVICRIQQHFNIHTLAAEDVLHVPQRPQVSIFDDHVFITIRMLTLNDDHGVVAEQVSLFIFKDLLITFQERPGDVWAPIRQRLERTGSRMRQRGSDYLAYCLIDACVDHCYPLLESYGNRLDELEEEIIASPRPSCVEHLYRLKRQLILIRRSLWPMREILDSLQRLEDVPIFTKETRRFLADVASHVIQIIDVLETYRELTGSLTDLYLSSISNRMNQVMKVLTLMASVFIPITFIAGVYGMNFEYIPELKFKYGYAVFWAITLSLTAGMLLYFKDKGWFDN